MHFSVYTFVSLAVFHHATSYQLPIPKVEEAVESMLHNLSAYTTYKAPPGVHNHTIPSFVPEPEAAAPYWLENINHQGISAFGPNGYTVFRNVKNYGATGWIAFSYIDSTVLLLIIIQEME